MPSAQESSASRDYLVLNTHHVRRLSETMEARPGGHKRVEPEPPIS